MQQPAVGPVLLLDPLHGGAPLAHVRVADLDHTVPLNNLGRRSGAKKMAPYLWGIVYV